MRNDDVRRERDQFASIFANPFGFACSPARIHSHVAANGPTQDGKCLVKCSDPGLIIDIIRRYIEEYANAPHALALLRTRRQWRECRQATKQGDKCAPSHCPSQLRGHAFSALNITHQTSKLRQVKEGLTDQFGRRSPKQKRVIYVVSAMSATRPV